MKRSVSLLAIVAGVAISGSAFAQVAAQKSALRKAEEAIYGRIETRHTTVRQMNAKDEIVNDIPKLDARPTIGTVIGKLDISGTTIFTKRADTTKIEKTVTYTELTYNMLEGAYGSIHPYAYTELNPNSGNVSTHQIGADLDTSYAIPTVVGGVTLSAFQYTYGVFTSGKGQADVAVRNETGRGSLSLAGESEDQIKQRDPEIDSYTGVGVKLAPAALPGFTVGLSNELRNFWVPKYVAKDVEGDQTVQLDGYARNGVAISKFSMGYKINDKLNLTNSLRHYTKGMYEAALNTENTDAKQTGIGYRWENRLILTANVF